MASSLCEQTYDITLFQHWIDIDKAREMENKKIKILYYELGSITSGLMFFLSFSKMNQSIRKSKSIKLTVASREENFTALLGWKKLGDIVVLIRRHF